MPTSNITDTLSGEPETFRDFALQCAASLPMFEDLNGRPLPQLFEAKDDTVELEYARAHFTLLRDLPLSEWEVRARATYDQAESARLSALANRTVEAARIEARMAEVQAWRPPTPEHDCLKVVMLERLSLALSRCKTTGLETPITRLTASEFKTLELKEARRALQLYADQHQKAVALAEQKTAWLEALRDSLEQPVPATT